MMQKISTHLETRMTKTIHKVHKNLVFVFKKAFGCFFFSKPGSKHTRNTKRKKKVKQVNT